MKRLVFAALAAWLLAACQVAQMRVPRGLEYVQPLTVDGANPRRWNTPVRFGSHGTTTAREGMSWDFGFRLLGLQTGVAFQPYRLVVESPGATVQAECVSRNVVLNRGDLSLDAGGVAQLPALACGFQGAGDGTLRLRTTATNAQQGEASFGRRTFQVRSIREFQGSDWPSGEILGYELRIDDWTVAAVETINQGRVWIDPDLDDRDTARVAAVITALLLYVPAEAGSLA